MDKVDLKYLLQNYEQKLCNKTFRYELNKKTIIDLIFYKENFCHLMGIHHVFDNDKRYLGINGYKLITESKITTDSLKKHNENNFNFIKDKLEYFDKLYEVVTNGNIAKFYIDKVKPYSIIMANFVIYHEDNEILLHLFLRRENGNTNQYAPVSFIVKTPNDRNFNQFISGQEYKNITKFEILE